MEHFNWDAVGPIVEACRRNAAELAASLSSALEQTVTLEVGDAAELRLESSPEAWAGPGLIVLAAAEGGAVAAIVPQRSGLLPPWCAAPDASGKSRLATLAQEWAELALPEGISATHTHAQYVDDARAALVRGGVAKAGGCLPLLATAGEETTAISLVWPLSAPAQLWAAEESSPTAKAEAATAAAAAPATSAKSTEPRGLGQLPGFTRSLLKIRVPVSVQLAAKRERIDEVIALSPGSIIKFDKGCDQLLQMIVGEHPVAEGEAVKIGEKFGFRVSAMLMPPEHFVPLQRPRRA
jgi:flagellar motor switch/type III secretory pathway protein FliN